MNCLQAVFGLIMCTCTLALVTTDNNIECNFIAYKNIDENNDNVRHSTIWYCNDRSIVEANGGALDIWTGIACFEKESEFNSAVALHNLSHCGAYAVKMVHFIVYCFGFITRVYVLCVLCR